MTLVDGRLTPAQLVKVDALYLGRYSSLETFKRYLEGDNPAIIDAPTKEHPDNRVPGPFAKKGVTTMQGFGYKAGNITFSAPDAGAAFLAKLREVFDANDEELQTSELAVDAMGQGIGYRLFRIDLDSKVRMYRVQPLDGYMVFDDTLDRERVAFVHYVKLDNGTEIKTVYYADAFETFKKTEKGAWEPDGEGPQEHPFNAVPAVEFTVNRDKVPMFKHVIRLIDEHDKVMSSAYANEREQFAQAYLLLMQDIDTTDEDANGLKILERIKQLRAFTGIGRGGDISKVQDAVAFLTKPSRGSDTAEEADRLERLIYEMMMIINPYDETIGASSGIALLYKLLPMEWLAASQDAYFDKGLQETITLIGNALSTFGEAELNSISIKHTRSLPPDLTSIAQQAGLLKGILSDETILGLFPSSIVPNVEDEIQRKADQAPTLDEMAAEIARQVQPPAEQPAVEEAP